MKREKARLEELRSMSYADYLQTPEWLETQRAAIKRSGNHCQVCNAGNVSLSAYHKSLENVGCEVEDDLIVLCAGCYDLLYQKLTQGGDVPEGPGESGEEATYNFSLGKKAVVFGSSAAVTMGLPLLLHAPLPAEVFGFAAAVALAVNSPKLYAEVRDSLPQPIVELIDGMAERKRVREANGEWSTFDRLLGRHMRGSAPTSSQADNRREDAQTPEPRRQSGWDVEPGDDLPQPPSVKKGTFVFSSVLERFTPTLDRIYLATTMDGMELFCPAEHLCHVALAGSTDGGKSSIMRMLMAQLCKAGAQVLLLNPHYTRYDIKKQEDWTPFEPYLVYDPMECRKYEVIEHYLKYTAETLLPRRLDKYANSQPTGKPYFIVMDELPSIIKRIPKAVGWLGELLREGRKVGIFLISASQDFLVKTVAPDGSGGAVRDCYRTAYYVGGDATTAKTLLDMAARDIPEDQLGQGHVMLRCARSPEAKKALEARVPYGDNAALYRLLGPSTYKPTRGETQTPSVELAPAPVIAQREAAVPEQVVQAASGGRSQTREVSRQSEGAASLRHPASGLPRILRAAYDAYVPGMSYRELGAELGYTDREAREIFLELRRRGLLHVQTEAFEPVDDRATAMTQETVVPARSSSARSLYSIPGNASAQVGRMEDLKPRSIDPADLAKAFALWQAGNSSVRKLEAAAKSAGYGWSNGRVRDLIDAMKKNGLIPQGNEEVVL
jgi:hypothetical protein